MPYNLCIDIGNSAAKIGIFSGSKYIITVKVAGNKFDLSYFKKNILSKYDIDQIMVSKVKPIDGSLRRFLHKNFRLIEMSHDLKIPVTIKYETPNTLGRDRLAAVCGAVRLYPRTDMLIIGVGTCITYDIVNRRHEYLGGNISPGLEMRLKAMHKYTAALPLASVDLNAKMLGRNTIKALQSGALMGIQAEIMGSITMFQEKYPNIKVLLAGGGADYYKKTLKKPIFAHPNLVLLGLNHILTLNA